MRCLGATLAVVLLGGTALWAGTDGLRAFTAEGARRLAVQETPRPLPDAVIEDQDGKRLRLADYRGRPLVVDFIYTRCPTLCSVLGTGFRQLARGLPPRALGEKVSLLSISFDPDHDTPPALKAYARRHGADGRGWRIVRVSDAAALGRLLDAFGIVAISDAFGGFQHNAAIHLVDGDGRLARIVDFDRPRQAAEVLVGWF